MMTTETIKTAPETVALMEDTIKQIFTLLLDRHGEGPIHIPFAILDIILTRLLAAAGDLYGDDFRDITVAALAKRLNECRSAQPRN